MTGCKYKTFLRWIHVTFFFALINPSFTLAQSEMGAKPEHNSRKICTTMMEINPLDHVKAQIFDSTYSTLPDVLWALRSSSETVKNKFTVNMLGNFFSNSKKDFRHYFFKNYAIEIFQLIHEEKFSHKEDFENKYHELLRHAFGKKSKIITLKFWKYLFDINSKKEFDLFFSRPDDNEFLSEMMNSEEFMNIISTINIIESSFQDMDDESYLFYMNSLIRFFKNDQNDQNYSAENYFYYSEDAFNLVQEFFDRFNTNNPLTEKFLKLGFELANIYSQIPRANSRKYHSDWFSLISPFYLKWTLPLVDLMEAINNFKNEQLRDENAINLFLQNASNSNEIIKRFYNVRYDDFGFRGSLMFRGSYFDDLFWQFIAGYSKVNNIILSTNVAPQLAFASWKINHPNDRLTSSQFIGVQSENLRVFDQMKNGLCWLAAGMQLIEAKLNLKLDEPYMLMLATRERLLSFVTDKENGLEPDPDDEQFYEKDLLDSKLSWQGGNPLTIFSLMEINPIYLANQNLNNSDAKINVANSFFKLTQELNSFVYRIYPTLRRIFLASKNDEEVARIKNLTSKSIENIYRKYFPHLNKLSSSQLVTEEQKKILKNSIDKVKIINNKTPHLESELVSIIKKDISHNHPIYLFIDTTNFDSKGVKIENQPKQAADHAVLITGYETDGSGNIVKVRILNSYGNDWGDQGSINLLWSELLAVFRSLAYFP